MQIVYKEEKAICSTEDLTCILELERYGDWRVASEPHLEKLQSQGWQRCLSVFSLVGPSLGQVGVTEELDGDLPAGMRCPQQRGWEMTLKKEHRESHQRSCRDHSVGEWEGHLERTTEVCCK